MAKHYIFVDSKNGNPIYISTQNVELIKIELDCDAKDLNDFYRQVEESYQEIINQNKLEVPDE